MKPDFYVCDHCGFTFKEKGPNHDEFRFWEMTDDTGRYRLSECSGTLKPAKFMKVKRGPKDTV